MANEEGSFSAHCDYTQTVDFVQHITPNHIVLVHGDPTKMGELRKELNKQFASAINVLSPKNCESIDFSFKTHLKAKVVGRLAEELTKFLAANSLSLMHDPMTDIMPKATVEEVKDDDRSYDKKNYLKVSGVITKRGSDIRVMAQLDVDKYTYLQPWYVARIMMTLRSQIKQKLYVPYHHKLDLIRQHLQTLFAHIKVNPEGRVYVP